MKNNLYEIGQVLDYIETHLIEETLELDTISANMHYSKYHLHRMFSSVTGLPLHSYILRRRLTEAARMLVFSDRPVLEIALCAGYDTQRSFSRSFRSVFHCAPAAYRKHRKFLPLQLKYDISNHEQLRGDRILDIKTVKEDSILLAGFGRSTKNGFYVIGKCWRLLHAKKEKIPCRTDKTFLIGVNDYTQFENESGHPVFSYFAGAPVTSSGELPRGMKHLTLPPSEYVVFSLRGRNEDSLQSVVEYIYREWFPRSTCHFNENNRYDFAKYGETVDENGLSDIEFWVPIT